jgi:hypothetical protein
MEGEGEAEALLRRRFHIAMALAAFIGHPSHFQVSLGGALALLANGAWETRSRTPERRAWAGMSAGIARNLVDHWLPERHCDVP